VTLHRRLHMVAALAGALLVGAAAPGFAAPPSGPPAPLGYTTYGAATTYCRPTDPRLDSISGIAVTSRGIFIQDDRRGKLWEIDSSCRPVREVPLPGVVALRDTEDVLSTPDGTLWIGDIGGNRFARTRVQIVRVPVREPPVTYSFSYPDGPHDADALLISPDHKQILIVTKVPSGVSTVFAPASPLRPDSTIGLKPVGTIRVNGLAERNPGKSALLITGGAVSPDGLHLVLRTYTEAWEWDAPDGNLAEALTGLPRKISLPVTKQGEGITYSTDGQALLAGGEQLDPVYRVSIERPRYAPTGDVLADQPPSRPVDRRTVAVVLLSGGLLCLIVLIGAVVAERRRGRRRSWAPDDAPMRVRTLSRNREQR
jgi:hypothetical protein